MDFKHQLIKAYDKESQTRSHRPKPEWKLQLRRQFAVQLKKEKKMTILEIGAGLGDDAKFFQVQGFEVLATDLSKEMVRQCRKRGVKARVMDIYEIATLKFSFDAVFSMNVMLHVPRNDLQIILKNIDRSLNDRGLFFYGVYGGHHDEETTFVDKNIVDLPRFYSFLSDETLLKTAQERFKVVRFQKIPVKDAGSQQPDSYFQALLLRKK